MTLFLRIVAVFLLVIVTTLSWSTPVGAYTSSTNTYSQKAVTYVKSYVSRLQRDGYSEDEVLDQIMNLRSIFIKRQQASLYSGRSSTEVTMIIAELESAISWYSARVGN
jgi:hypothetical protein